VHKTESNGKAEQLLGMGAARRLHFELTGLKPGLSTVHRWRLKGRLRAVMIGGRLYTTEMLAADAARDRGTVNARGTAAAERIERIAASMPRRKGGRR
jgi:hypothetical protein